MKDLKERAVRGGVVKIIGQAVNFAIRLLYVVVMARLLDPEDFGLVAMVTVVTGIYELFTSAGLSAAAVQRYAISNEQSSVLFWINILIGFILAIICLATAPVLSDFYKEPRLYWITIAMAAGFLFNAAGIQHYALLQRNLRYITLTVIETLSHAASVAVGISLALWGFDYWSLVTAAISAPAILTILLWISTSWIPTSPRRAPDLMALLRFGGTITLNNLIIYVAYNADKLLIGRYWGADALGIYGRAYQLVNIPSSNLNAAVGGVAFSALSRLQYEPVRLRSYFLKGYTLVNSLTIPTTIFCALFAEQIVSIVLGAKWSDAALIFQLLAPTILVFGMINPTAWLLQSAGLQNRSLKIACAIAPLVITAYLVGLSFGPVGVATGFSVAMLAWLVPHFFWCLHGTVIAPEDILRAIAWPLVASFLAGFATFASDFLLFQGGTSGFLRLSIAGVLMCIAYLGTLMLSADQRRLYFDLIASFKNTQSQRKTSGRQTNS